MGTVENIRICWQAVRPSISGITKSSMTKSISDACFCSSFTA